MLTSFAPSPIAKVVFEGNLLLIMLTMSAFYFGETLQARTTSALSDPKRNLALNESLASIIINDAPATTIDYLLPDFLF
jgi:hypothetical protein